jgi:soluble lytic murein transglycosylase
LKGAIDTALSQGNHPAALQVLKRFAPQMQTADLLQAHQAITHAEQAQAAQHISNQVLGHFLPMMQTAPQDQAFNLLMTAESGGRQFADDGAVLTSGKGAKGKAQLMPETGPEAAKLAGLPWQPALFNRGKTGDAAKDAEAEQYNFALGHAYFNQQLRDFKGDMGLTFAAYNAGPGTVRQALQQSAQQGGNWLSYLPKETQTYVSGKLQAFAVGEGQFPQPSLEQVLAAADRHIQTTYGDTATPQLHQQVLEQVTQQFEQHKQTIKQANDAGVAEAYRQLQLNGGQFAALPVAVRNAIPADKVNDVMGFARRISQGQEPQTDWALYYQLRTHRPLLKSTNLLALKDRLGDTEFKQLVNLQQTQAAPGSHSTSVRTAADILHSFMAQAGIDPVPRADDREQAATVGKIWSAYEQRVADFEALNGRKASTQDLEKVAAQLFTRVPVSSWLHGTEEKLGILLDKDKDQVVVPTSDRQQIVQALRQTFPDRPVTEQDIVYAYLRGKGLM